jgi:hypothetical protein
MMPLGLEHAGSAEYTGTGRLGLNKGFVHMNNAVITLNGLEAQSVLIRKGLIRNFTAIDKSEFLENVLGDQTGFLDDACFIAFFHTVL